MAYNPHFTFADPALQNAVVNEAQIQAAREAARAQQFAQTLAAIRQERQAAADREERRAERDRVIREGEARSAENKRQFDESLKYNREALAANKEIAAGREKKVETKEDYNNMLRLLDVRNDASTLPTVKELESRMAGLDLTDKQKQSLREERQRSYDTHKRNAKLIQDEVNGLNALLDSGKKDKDGNPLTPDRILKGSQFKSSIGIDWDRGRLKPLISLPREDAVFHEEIPQPSPGFVPRDTDFKVPLLPGQGPTPVSEPISAAPQQRQPGFFERYGRALMDYNIYPPLRLINRYLVPPVNPPPPHPAGVEPIQAVLDRRAAGQSGGGPSFSVSIPNIMRGGLGGGFYVPEDQQVVPVPQPPVLDAGPPEYRYDMPPMFIGEQH